MFYEIDEHVNCEIYEILYSSHHQVHTRILFHISKLLKNINIVIRASDTDILIIALGKITTYIIDSTNLSFIKNSRSNNKYLCWVNFISSLE